MRIFADLARSNALPLVSPRLKQALFNTIKGGAFFNKVAFLKQRRVKIARYPRFDFNAIDGLNATYKFAVFSRSPFFQL